jgi:hypothetical protein
MEINVSRNTLLVKIKLGFFSQSYGKQYEDDNFLSMSWGTDQKKKYISSIAHNYYKCIRTVASRT